jgi:hypothetical protein
MKLLTCYTPSHKVFIKSFQTIHDVDPEIHTIVRELDQECPTGTFAEEGWKITTARKFDFILEELDKAEEGELLIFSDIDVQFFRPISTFAEKALANHDIVFQNDYYGHACTGFFYMRNIAEVRKLISAARMIIPQWRDDQEAMNKILPTWEGRYGLLPPQFFTFGMFYQHWDGQDQFPLPPGIVMHHANWVKGIEKKRELLNIVKNIHTYEESIKSDKRSNQVSQPPMG